MPEYAPENSPLRRKFVARQPIFDRDRNVIAYELLFRSGLDNVFDSKNHQDDASSKLLLNSFLLFDMKELAGGKLVFVNFTRKVLLSGLAASFPRDQLVIELLETILPETEVIEACKELKGKGYRLALDDFVFRPEFMPLMEFMDIVKIDFIDTPLCKRYNIFNQVRQRGIKFLAEKVETQEEFEQAREMGYHYFQGYFFSHPVMVSTQDIPSLKSNLLHLLSKLYRENISLLKLEQIIKRDVSLAYKLIRFINSATFGLAVEVQSIMHALNLLGINELRKWISLVVLSQISKDHSEELMTNSIIRARFSELVCMQSNMKERCAEFFLVGLFSNIDIFFERPMGAILDELPLSVDVKEALLSGTGLFGDVLELVKAYERGQWSRFFKQTTKLGVNEEIIPDLYFQTITWSNTLNI